MKHILSTRVCSASQFNSIPHSFPYNLFFHMPVNSLRFSYRLSTLGVPTSSPSAIPWGVGRNMSIQGKSLRSQGGHPNSTEAAL